MRIRSIRPEFWSSEDIAAHDWATRLIFIGLWSYVDDNGVGRDNPRLIKADLFPLEDDPHGALMQVTGALQHLNAGGQICRYRVDGKSFLHICAWATNQVIARPSKGRYTHLTCEDAAQAPNTHADYMSPPANVVPGEGEKGRRGEGEKGRSDEADASSGAAVVAVIERDDVTRICAHLADLIENNGSKRPSITTAWETAARLMLDKDGRSEEEVHGAITWCQADEFWRGNILSLPKLRDKYDQLRLQSQRKGTSGSSRNDQFQAQQERALARAIEKERQMGLRE